MEAAEALVFDFNGTLSDDEPLLLAIYQELFAAEGRPLSASEYFGELAGRSEEAIIGSWLGVDGALTRGARDRAHRTYVDAPRRAARR